MRRIEEGTRVTHPTGGIGGLVDVNEALNLTNSQTSITAVGDDGGHSEFCRSFLGVLPPGDATQQIAIHIRDEESRELLTERWQMEGPRKGVRPGSEILALAEQRAGSHSAGIKRIEKAFRADYRGKVVPISNDDFYIRVLLDNAPPRFGESSIDKMVFGDPAIVDIEFVNRDNSEIVVPRVYSEAVEAAANSDIFWIPPGTFWGSHMQIAKVPGFAEAVRMSRGPVVWVCNAVNTPETDGYTASTFAEKFANAYGREIDIAIIDDPVYRLPKNYWHPDCKDANEARDRVGVKNDLKNSGAVRKVITGRFSRIVYIGTKEAGYKYVIRHHGPTTMGAVQDALETLTT